MNVQKKAWSLVVVVVAVAATVVLATGLSALELRPAQPFAMEAPAEGGEWGLQPGTRALEIALQAFVIIAGVLLPFSVLYFIVSPDARKQVLRMLASLIWIPALYIAIRARPELFNLDQNPPLNPNLAVPGTSPFAAPVEFTANPSLGLVLSLTIFTGAIAAMGIIAAVWSVWQRTRRQKRSLQQLGEEAQEAIDQLCAGADLKDVVLRCYVDMSHTLQESKGIERDKAMTPREFEQHLMNTGLPHEHVQQLTRLFEAVRYGAKHLGETEQQQAIRCLSAIVETCGSPT